MRKSDRNGDSNRGRGHQRTTADTRARDQDLPHACPRLSVPACDYGSEGYAVSAWQPCGRRLRECIDDVCRSMGACAWPPEAPAGLDTGGKGRGAADSVSSEVTAAPPPQTEQKAGGPWC